MYVCIDMIDRMLQDISARTCRMLLFETPLASRMSLVLTPLSWLGLGVGARANDKEFGLLTVLQGGVPKAITDLA